MTTELLPCPFCGNDEPAFERTGTSRHSCIVACGNCGCRHESGDEYGNSGKSWNTRAALSQRAPTAAADFGIPISAASTEAAPVVPSADMRRALDAVYQQLKDGDTMGAALAMEGVLKGIDALSTPQAVEAQQAGSGGEPIGYAMPDQLEHLARSGNASLVVSKTAAGFCIMPLYSSRAAPAEPAPSVTRQQVFDRFAFLEGMVDESTYRRIAETALALAQGGAK